MFVQDERLISLFDVPVALPQALIPAGAWTAIATIMLPANATIDYRWLQITVASAQNTNPNDPCGTSAQSAINSDFPNGSLVALFLIKDWSPTATPWTQTVIDTLVAPPNPADAPGIALPLIVARNLNSALDITAAGNYTFVILNNTTNRDLSVTVTGAVTVDSDPLATA